jgi:hypothetical protein
MTSSTDELNKLDSALCITSEDDQIDLQEFLDFLILAYRINDVLTTDKDNIKHDTHINWTEISRNNLFSRLLSKKYDTVEEEGKIIMQSTSIERIQYILKHKLKEIMNEGILDSVLPFIVKKTLTTNALKTFESFGSKTSNSLSKDKLCLKQKCNATENLSRSKGE